MPDQKAPTLLSKLIEQSEYTTTEIIAKFQQCAQDNGLDASLSIRTLRRWTAGHIRTMPHPSQCRVARLLWGHPMSELLAPAPPDAPFRPPLDPTATDAPGHALAPVRPGQQHLTNPGDTGSDIERRLRMATKRAARFTAAAEIDNIGPETLAQIWETVSELANAYVHDPLVTILGDLPELQDSIFRLLEGKQKPALTGELYLLAGLVSGMIAKASHDLGHPHDAMTHARTMYVCADNAGHTGARAWARGIQSLIAYWAGRPQEAIRYARQGAEIATDHHGTVAAWLPSLEARAWAIMAIRDEAIHALDRAQDRCITHISDDLDDIGGLFTFPRPKQHYYNAGTFVHLDDEHQRAQSEALTSLELFELGHPDERSFSDEAGAYTELALARIHNNEFEGVRSALEPVLDLPPERRIGGIIISTTRVHQALSRRHEANSSTVTTIQEEIEAFCRTPAASLPR